MTAEAQSDRSHPDRPQLARSMALRRQRILDAAVELFHTQGYLGTTVDEIAARANVTKRTLYHHMGSKENVLHEIHSRFIEEGVRRWDAVIEKGGSATEVLGGLIEQHVEVVGLNRTSIAVFFDEAKHLNAEARVEIAAQRDRYELILRGVIERGVSEDDFRADLDVSVTTLLVLGGLTEMNHWYKPSTRAARRAAIDLCLGMVLDGVSTS